MKTHDISGPNPVPPQDGLLHLTSNQRLVHIGVCVSSTFAHRMRDVTDLLERLITMELLGEACGQPSRVVRMQPAWTVDEGDAQFRHLSVCTAERGVEHGDEMAWVTVEAGGTKLTCYVLVTFAGEQVAKTAPKQWGRMLAALPALSRAVVLSWNEHELNSEAGVTPGVPDAGVLAEQRRQVDRATRPPRPHSHAAPAEGFPD